MRFLIDVSILFIFAVGALLQSQRLAVLKYQGGGDWYSNPTSVTNLIKFCNAHIGSDIKLPYEVVSAGSSDIFKYPIVFMTGHGNVFFDELDIENLQTYLLSGGFIHIDDNYGIKPYITRELKKIFPKKSFREIPASHPIFSSHYSFPKGLPKIHEHDGKRPQAFGLFDGSRLMVLFTYETDLSDGWENAEVHHDDENIRHKALKMGANIVSYIFKN